MISVAVKRSGALSPAPPGKSEGEGGGWVKNNSRDDCFLSRCAEARLPLNKRCIRSPLSGTPLAARSLYPREGESAIVGSGQSGLSSVFPAIERGGRHSHLHEESGISLVYIQTCFEAAIGIHRTWRGAWSPQLPLAALLLSRGSQGESCGWRRVLEVRWYRAAARVRWAPLLNNRPQSATTQGPFGVQ